MPVEKRSFREIRIEILTLEGIRIPFRHSKSPTKVVLHFRRVPTNIKSLHHHFDNIHYEPSRRVLPETGESRF
jgi:hypothetical protein